MLGVVKSHTGYGSFRLLFSVHSFIQSMAIGAGVGRTTIGALANSPHCVRSPQLRMRTSYAWPQQYSTSGHLSLLGLSARFYIVISILLNIRGHAFLLSFKSIP